MPETYLNSLGKAEVANSREGSVDKVVLASMAGRVTELSSGLSGGISGWRLAKNENLK